MIEKESQSDLAGRETLRLSAEKLESFNRTMRWLAALPRLDQRWQLACEAAQGVPVPSDLVGFIDLEAVAYLKLLAVCTTDNQRAAVQARWPAIAQALAIFEHSGPRRWEVDARLVVGQTDEEIAGRCDLDAATVAAYEKLFWSVREFLDMPGWLNRKLFPGWLWPTFRNDELSRLWLFVGLDGGPAVLDSFVKAFHAAWQIGTPPVLSVYIRRGSPLPVNMQAAVATCVLPANRATAGVWVAFHVRLMGAEAMSDPRQREVAFLRLRQDFVAYARGVLEGKPPEKLRHLLRLGRQTKNGRDEELPHEAALADLLVKLRIDQPPLEVGQGGAT